jgi:hypothetical protein
MYSLILLHVQHRKEKEDLTNGAEPDKMSPEEMTLLFQQHKEQINADSASAHSQYLRSLQRSIEDLELPDHFRQQPADVSGSVGPDHTGMHGNDNGTTGHLPEGDVFDPDNLRYVESLRSDPSLGDPDVTGSRHAPSGPIDLDVDQIRAINIVRGYCLQLENWHMAILNKTNPSPIRPAPPHIFLTGPAGTGKSVVIKEIIKVINRYSDEMSKFLVIKQKGVCVTASTGVAAQAFEDGQTTHSALFMKPDKKTIVNMDEFVDKLGGKNLQSLKDKFQNVICLIIDECSMMNPLFLYQVHLRANLIMGFENQPGVYFGNWMVITVGDFYQLKPVRMPYLFEDLNNCSINLFRLLFHPVFLTTIHRQKEDIPFMELLSRVRVGNQNESDYDKLSTAMVALNQERYLKFFKSQPHLYTTRLKAHQQNIAAVRDRDSSSKQVYMFRATDYFSSKDVLQKPRGMASDTPTLHDIKATEKLGLDVDKTSGLSEFCIVWIGAKVMLIKNYETSDKLVNGSTGTVIGIQWDHSDSENPVGPVFPVLDVAGHKRAVDWWYKSEIGSRSQKATLPENVVVTHLPYGLIVKFDNEQCGVRAGRFIDIENANGVVERGVLIGNFLIQVYRDQHNKEVDSDNEEESRIVRDSVRIASKKSKSSKTKAPKTQHLVRIVLPFTLAYGFTTHKAQGMTLTRVSVALDNKNVAARFGTAYVGISRATNFRGLAILELDRRGFGASPKVKAEYARLSKLVQAGTPSNPLGNTVIHMSKKEMQKRALKKAELNLQKDFEAHNEAGDKENGDAYRLRQIPGESQDDRNKRLRREKAKQKGKKRVPTDEERPRKQSRQSQSSSPSSSVSGEAAAPEAGVVTGAAALDSAAPNRGGAMLPGINAHLRVPAAPGALLMVTGQVGGNTRRLLTNLGNTCYANAVLQCLFNCVPMTVVANLPLMSPGVNEVVSKFRQLLLETRGYAPRQGRSRVTWDHVQYGPLLRHSEFQVGVQHDASEYLMALTNWTSENAIAAAGQVPPNHPLFHCMSGEYQSEVLCGPHCPDRGGINGFNGDVSHHPLRDRFSFLSLPIGMYFTIQSTIDAFFTDEEVDDGYSCYIHSTVLSPGSMRRTTWVSYPQILVLHMKRFVTDMDIVGREMRARKDMTELNVDLELRPDPRDRNIIYDLESFVNHIGNSLAGGHYVAYIRDTFAANPAGSRWNLYNDDKTTMQQTTTSHFLRKSNQVYLLFYKRRA